MITYPGQQRATDDPALDPAGSNAKMAGGGAAINLPAEGYGGTQLTPGVHGGTADVLNRIYGQVDPHNPEIGPAIIVNPHEYGITGWGDDNNQLFQSSHTSALITNDSAEQGMGVGPERKWPHYPTPDNPNPFRAKNVLRRMGGDTYSASVYRPEAVAYWAQAIGHELSQEPVKHRFTGRTAVVNQAPSQPYVNIIPPVSPGGYFG